MKQERRGGIETIPSFSAASEKDAKEERRGGIETLYPLLLTPHRNIEAGTPWWH